MAIRCWQATILGWIVWATTCGTSRADSPISALTATARDGQVFLSWREAETAEGSTFNVYVSGRPIVDVAGARRVAHHVERHSARDWWEDPASFTVGKTPGKAVGFLIRDGGQRLDPSGGLFVHRVREDEKGPLYFAVIATDLGGREDRGVVAGDNSLRDPVAAEPGAIRPIWQRGGPMPAPGAGDGKALWLELHAKGGVVADMEYLAFGDETMGWRAGLPFKFSVRIAGDTLFVRPTDRVWINRPHREAGDGGTPAIWTFWYGYNSRIYDRALMTEGIPTNYTERRNLWILDWVREHYRPDPARWYCSGSSMGGCGTISFGLRHPERFAALHAHVPIVSYTYLGRGSAHRFEPSCGVGPIGRELKTAEGVPLLDQMNGTKYVLEAKADLPPVFLVNGRKDASIPWENNPPFYQALSNTHQHFAAFWDDGDHATCGKDAPPDVKDWKRTLRRFRSDESFPAFANTSSDRDPGDGRPDVGDIVGWINRGMDWTAVRDSRRQYEITLLADYPGLAYPVQTDVTLRRVQVFRPGPGERLDVRIGESPPTSVRVDVDGRVTIPKVVIPSKAGVRVTLKRTGPDSSSSP